MLIGQCFTWYTIYLRFLKYMYPLLPRSNIIFKKKKWQDPARTSNCHYFYYSKNTFYCTIFNRNHWIAMFRKSFFLIILYILFNKFYSDWKNYWHIFRENTFYWPLLHRVVVVNPFLYTYLFYNLYTFLGHPFFLFKLPSHLGHCATMCALFHSMLSYIKCRRGETFIYFYTEQFFTSF